MKIIWTRGKRSWLQFTSVLMFFGCKLYFQVLRPSLLRNCCHHRRRFPAWYFSLFSLPSRRRCHFLESFFLSLSSFTCHLRSTNSVRKTSSWAQFPSKRPPSPATNSQLYIVSFSLHIELLGNCMFEIFLWLHIRAAWLLTIVSFH